MRAEEFDLTYTIDDDGVWIEHTCGARHNLESDGLAAAIAWAESHTCDA